MRLINPAVFGHFSKFASSDHTHTRHHSSSSLGFAVTLDSNRNIVPIAATINALNECGETWKLLDETTLSAIGDEEDTVLIGDHYRGREKMFQQTFKKSQFLLCSLHRMKTLSKNKKAASLYKQCVTAWTPAEIKGFKEECKKKELTKTSQLEGTEKRETKIQSSESLKEEIKELNSAVNESEEEESKEKEREVLAPKFAGSIQEAVLEKVAINEGENKKEEEKMVSNEDENKKEEEIASSQVQKAAQSKVVGKQTSSQDAAVSSNAVIELEKVEDHFQFLGVLPKDAQENAKHRTTSSYVESLNSSAMEVRKHNPLPALLLFAHRYIKTTERIMKQAEKASTDKKDLPPRLEKANLETTILGERISLDNIVLHTHLREVRIKANS